MAVLEKVDGVREIFLGVLVLGVPFRDQLANHFEFIADAVLLADELVHVDGVGEVQFEQLVLLAGETVTG
ncbi:hypothetical protein [Agrococcus casei]|uniref:hypothetical protein n=1 Tax=Agrococcus casei TaxID=343512 RepID=UPI000B363D83|nr:hypothetical protein [Agrococcus casei]